MPETRRANRFEADATEALMLTATSGISNRWNMGKVSPHTCARASADVSSAVRKPKRAKKSGVEVVATRVGETTAHSRPRPQRAHSG